MPTQVVTGATLQCSLGASPATFSASGTKVQATTTAGVVSDVGTANVPPFGLCSAPSNPAVIAAQGSPQPCMPVLSPWTPGSVTTKIGGVAALDDASQCQCSWGGKITVSDAGQKSKTVT